LATDKIVGTTTEIEHVKAVVALCRFPFQEPQREREMDLEATLKLFDVGLSVRQDLRERNLKYYGRYSTTPGVVDEMAARDEFIGPARARVVSSQSVPTMRRMLSDMGAGGAEFCHELAYGFEITGLRDDRGVWPLDGALVAAVPEITVEQLLDDTWRLHKLVCRRVIGNECFVKELWTESVAEMKDGFLAFPVRASEVKGKHVVMQRFGVEQGIYALYSLLFLLEQDISAELAKGVPHWRNILHVFTAKFVIIRINPRRLFRSPNSEGRFPCSKVQNQ